MNIKDKKVKIGIAVVLIATVIGIPTVMGYGQINQASNNHVSSVSELMNIKNHIMDNKSEIKEVEGKVQSMNPDKENPTELKIILAEIEKIDFADENKINENVKLADSFNVELDKMIDTFKNNDEMKKDVKLSNEMIEMENVNNFVDNMMESYNQDSSKAFNESINKFPVSLVKSNNGWYTLDKFTSVN